MLQDRVLDAGQDLATVGPRGLLLAGFVFHFLATSHLLFRRPPPLAPIVFSSPKTGQKQKPGLRISLSSVC